MNVYVFLQILYFALIFEPGNCCSLETDWIGTWTSNAFETITVTSNGLTLGKHSFHMGGKTSSSWTCYNNETSPFVVIRSELFTLNTDDTYAYICLSLTQSNINSYYFYMNSPTLSLMSNERVVVYAATATPGNIVTSVCTETPSTAEFISMVRTGSEADALVNCPDPLHRNFTYTFNIGRSELCTTDSFLSACPGRQQLEFDYTKCSNWIAYSSGGQFGCVTTIDDGSGTQFVALYNFEAMVNGISTFRFSCAAVQDTSSGNVQVSYTANRCEAGQTYSARTGAINSGLVTLTPNGTCEITTTTTSTTTTTTTEATTEANTTTEASTTTESPIPILTTDSVNVGAIIGGILGAIIFIFLLLFLILYCIHRKKLRDRQRAIIDRRLKLFKVKQAQSMDDDQKVLTEPSLDPDFPQPWHEPKQAPIPPVKKYITRDMMSQTDLLKEMKKIHPPPPPLVTEKQRPAPTPKYLPWPWRTAKRASQKSQFQSQSNLNKFGPLTETTQDCVSLANYTISKYGIKYDDAGVDHLDQKIPNPPTRFIPRAQSFRSLSRASSRASFSRSSSLTSLNRSRSMQDIQTPTPRRVHLSRAPSLKSLRSFTERTQTHVLMSIEEKKKKEERVVIDHRPDDSIRPIPHYMFPIRSKSVTKFDLKKTTNPLAFPLKRSKTTLRPIPNKSKKKKSKVKKNKNKKIKLTKKKSPYSVIPTPPRQITLIPLSRQQKTAKVKPGDIKHKRPKSIGTSFPVSPETKSPKTADTSVTESPDTGVSSNNTDSFIARTAETSATKEDYQGMAIPTIPKTVDPTRGMSGRSATTDYHDSGISADESSLDKPKSEYAIDSGQLKLPTTNKNDQPDQIDSEQLKFPAINSKTDHPMENVNDEHRTEEIPKLPFLETQQKSTVRPWR